MGQPAFAFARAGMSASRGIETLRDCEIQDGDLQNLSLREAKNETSKPVTNNSEILRSGQNFPRPTFFKEPFYDIPLQVGQPACSYKHSNNFKMI